MSFVDLKAELMRAEFPFLRPDHDPDIERYYELRSRGRPAEALAFYNSRLTFRYPDPDTRTKTLRAYRLNSPEYPRFIAEAYGKLADLVLERVKRAIKYIALHASSYDPQDAYATIRAAEAILKLLPPERFEAIAAMERYRRYADALNYQQKPVAAAEELMRAYLTERLDVVEATVARRADERRKAYEEKRSLLVAQDKADARAQLDARRRRDEIEDRKREEAMARRPGAPRRQTAAVIDLSTIRFSAADLARIQIPPVLTKVEDKALAFCFKYWNLVEDAAFERVLFLYSRKFKVKHYDVFKAIREGRRRGHKDEEILAAISALVTSGYYYSIRGDLYLQRNWAMLKAKIDPAAAAAAETAARKEAARTAGTALRRRRPSQERIVTKSAGLGDGGTAADPEASAAMHSDTARTPSAAAPRSAFSRPAEPQAPPPAPALTAKQALAAVKARRAAEAAAPIPETADRRAPGGSVADRLRKLSGRSYDVFQDRFLAKARGAIRVVLYEAKTGHRSLFASLPTEVENLIYDFLKDHYEDPYMDWEGGDERARLSRLGYELESLDPVIAECYRRL